MNKGDINSLASSPDGKTLYAAADGTVWSVPSAGGDARKVREGDSIIAYPDGRHLLVAVVESSKFRLFRVPLDGGSEDEIKMHGSIPLWSGFLSPNALNADVRLLLSLAPWDSWFNSTGILDTATGRLTRIPGDDVSDIHSMAWLPDGKIMELRVGLRSTLWKFQPQK